MKKAVIIDNIVSTIIELEEGSNWTPPPGAMIIDAGNAEIGWSYTDAGFIAPTGTKPTPPPDEADRKTILALAIQPALTADEQMKLFQLIAKKIAIVLWK